MSGRSRSYKDGLYRRLQNNADAVLYLQAALEDSQEAFLAALKNVLEARNLSETARQCDLDRANIYRMLGAKGNPTLKSLEKILHSLGLRLSVALEDSPQKAIVQVSEPRHVFVSYGHENRTEYAVYQSVSYRNESLRCGNSVVHFSVPKADYAGRSNYEIECESSELAMAS